MNSLRPLHYRPLSHKKQGGGGNGNPLSVGKWLKISDALLLKNTVLGCFLDLSKYDYNEGILIFNFPVEIKRIQICFTFVYPLFTFKGIQSLPQTQIGKISLSLNPDGIHV